MTKPKSSTLFHFTKSLEILKSILDKGFFPRYCLEDISWLAADKSKKVAFPVVCFCDIPLSRLNEHVNFYGYYGIGMTREWALSNGLNPIMYLSPTSPLAGSIRANMRAIINTKDKDKYLVYARTTLAFSKPLIGTIVVNGIPVEKEFYQESEWRFLARHKGLRQVLQHEKFTNPEHLERENEKAVMNATLTFSPSDTKYIFVKSDADIPDLVNYININLDRYPSAQLKVLATRILSLEQIEKDI